MILTLLSLSNSFISCSGNLNVKFLKNGWDSNCSHVQRFAGSLSKHFWNWEESFWNFNNYYLIWYWISLMKMYAFPVNSYLHKIYSISSCYIARKFLFNWINCSRIRNAQSAEKLIRFENLHVAWDQIS